MWAVKGSQRGAVSFLGVLILTTLARAGGPIVFNEADGRAFSWRDHRAVYVVETGPFSQTINNATAANVVTDAFAKWTANWTGVPTPDLRIDNLDDVLPFAALAPFKRNISLADYSPVTCPIPQLDGAATDVQRSRIDCDLLRACIAQDLVNCPSPIIFDDDGSITALFFGQGSGILGFSGPLLLALPPAPAEAQIVQAFSVLNGLALDSSQSCKDPVKDPNGTLLFESVAVHEFGHFLGLGHSDVNGDVALFNPAIGKTGGIPPSRAPRNPGDTAGPTDGLSAVLPDDTETMYPFAFQDADGCVNSNTLENDDRAIIAALYPGSPNGAQTGTLAGSVFIPCTPEEEKVPNLCISANGSTADQRKVKRAQGVLVTARRLDTDSEPFASGKDLDGDGLPDARLLKEAFSQLTGDTFAPQRCVGTVGADVNGNGTIDIPVASGLFGACGTLADCQNQLSNFLGISPLLFTGQCGFFSAQLSKPLPLGDEEENSFKLTGLPPGQYLVQVTQPLRGGFSSPVRTAVGVGALAPIIESDDNQTFTVFPNPQTGEFYNGSPTGCDGPLTACGKESSDPKTDNPLAYTVIEVKAGGQVNNINIFLNSASTVADLLSDPGLDLCRLGDVNGDRLVNQDDIFAVAQAEKAFEANPQSPLSESQRRADLNEDGQITFLDVDLITDLVLHPDPVPNPNLGQTIGGTASYASYRGSAPFSAICQEASRNGCKILPPDNVTRADGTPTLLFCASLDPALPACLINQCQPAQPAGCTAITVPITIPSGVQFLTDTDQESVFRSGRFSDCYTFSGSAGQQIVIQARSDKFDTFLGLVGPDGKIVSFNDDCSGDGANSCIPGSTLSGGALTLPSAGTYTLEVTSFNVRVAAEDATYSLKLSTPGFPSTGCTAIAVPEMVNGTLSSSDHQSVFRPGSFADCYTFSGSAGQEIFLQAQGDFNTFLTLIGPDGKIVSSNNDCQGDSPNSCIPDRARRGVPLSLPSDGLYAIEVSSFRQAETGNYLLTLSDQAPTVTPVGCTALDGPGTIGGTLTNSDQPSLFLAGHAADCYTFPATAGQSVFLQARGTFDTFLTLVGPDGRALAFNDDCVGDGLNSCLPSTALIGDTITLPDTGTYTIEVSSFASQVAGDYVLKLSEPGFTLTGCTAINVPTTVNGTLSSTDHESAFRPGSFADCYTFSGSAGQEIFLLLAGNFDTILTLLGPDGEVVFNNNCPGAGSNSCIPDNALTDGVFSLPSNGVYTVEVTSFRLGVTTGNYILTAGP